MDRKHHRTGQPDPRRRAGTHDVSRRRAASARAPVRLVPGRPRANPAADGRRRQGAGRLHGRRHAAGGALRPPSGPAPLLPPELQPGHQPADRQFARAPGDEPEHPAGAISATSSTRVPIRPRICCCCPRRCSLRRSSRRCAATWARPRRALTPSLRSRVRRRCAPGSNASAARRKTRCARAAPTSSSPTRRSMRTTRRFP